jgi:hypothetical protein
VVTSAQASIKNMNIHDGTGSGVMAGVSETHRLLVDADSHDAIITSATDGKAFKFGTDIITLTSANVSGVFYLKNGEEANLIISEILFQANQSTGGASGIGTWKVIRNPTAGTLISNATATPIRQNFNFGSTRTITADAFKGVEGATVTGGNDFTIQNGFTVPNRVIAPFTAIILPRGSSLAVTFTPPAGNTSIAVSVGISAFLNSRFFASKPAL